MGHKRNRDSSNSSENVPERQAKRRRRERTHSQNDTWFLSSLSTEYSANKRTTSPSASSSASETSPSIVTTENPFLNMRPTKGYFPQLSTYHVPYYVTSESERHAFPNIYGNQRPCAVDGHTSPSESAQSDVVASVQNEPPPQAHNSGRSNSGRSFASAVVENGASEGRVNQSNVPSELGMCTPTVEVEERCDGTPLPRGYFPQLSTYNVPFYDGLEATRPAYMRGRLYPNRRFRVLDGHKSSFRSVQNDAFGGGQSSLPLPSENGGTSLFPASQRNPRNATAGRHSNNPSEISVSTISRRAVKRGVRRSSSGFGGSVHFRFQCPLSPYPHEKHGQKEWTCFNCICYICDKPRSKCFAWTEHCTLTDKSERSRRMRKRSLAIQKRN